jgi:hypothetical protein
MGDSLQSLISAAPWAPLAVAFLVGLVCGWLIWGLRGASAEGAEITPAAAAESGGDERKEIVVLDQHDTPQEDITSQLLAVDEALKRANGRLKVIQRGLKR